MENIDIAASLALGQTKTPFIKKFVNNIGLLFVGILIGVSHYYMNSTIHERNESFHLLSDVERELTFRTEQGFYYSFYKTIVTADTFYNSLLVIRHDNLVEHPNETNSFIRFNIVPEVIIGYLYRSMSPKLVEKKKCGPVQKENGDIIEVCTGLGEPVYFYLETIWYLSGLTLAMIFWFASSLSNTVFGGILATALYLANHSDCTRVMWTPNERENFAQPFLLLQMWLVTKRLRNCESSLFLQIMTLVVNAICLLTWQFSQYIFLTQLTIIFMMHQLYIIDHNAFDLYLYVQFAGLQLALFLQGQDLLKTSYYLTFLISAAIYRFFLSCRKEMSKHIHIFIEVVLIFFRTLAYFYIGFNIKSYYDNLIKDEDDGHIFDLLYSKFFDFNNFHTLIYTCSPVFSFLPTEYFYNVTASGLLILVAIALYFMINYWYESGKKRIEIQIVKKVDKKKDKNNKNKNGAEDSGQTEEVVFDTEAMDREYDPLILYLRRVKIDSGIFYNISQCGAFGILAFLVMRLKLLFTPHLCLVASLVCHARYSVGFLRPDKFRKAFAVAVAASCLTLIIPNYNDAYNKTGVYNNPPLENLVSWVRSNTTPTTSFAGSMPLMSAILLTARRPIINHPQYESANSRARNYAVYKVYGKFNPKEVYEDLSKYKLDYLILERKYCFEASALGCRYQQIWDVEAPKLKGQPSLCHRLFTQEVEHFYPVYKNCEYLVLKLHDYSLKYRPRLYTE